MVSSPTGGYEAHPLRMGYFILRFKTLYFMLYAMVAWLLCGTQIAHASPTSSDTSIDALLVHANEKELHLDPGWLKLLHYRKTPFGWRSAAR